MKTWVGFSLIALMISATVYAGEPASIEVRAEVYQKYFYPQGMPNDYLDVQTERALPKLRKLMTVLPGTLYRAGGAGGTVQLTSAALQGLCEAGFSLAVYAYSEGFKPVGPVHCTDQVSGQPNTLEYIAGDANLPAFKSVVLRKLHDVISDPNKGPVLVHCWNGLHASGELAAIALRQFCDWSGPSATAYWLRHAGGYPPISRINSFVPYPALDIPTPDRQVLCRQAK